MVETSLLRLLFFPVMSAPYIFIMAGAQEGNAKSGPYVATRYRLKTTLCRPLSGPTRASAPYESGHCHTQASKLEKVRSGLAFLLSMSSSITFCSHQPFSVNVLGTMATINECERASLIEKDQECEQEDDNSRWL